MKSIPIICILTVLLLFSCSHEVEPLPDHITISNQADIDLICEAMMEVSVYNSSISIVTEEVLDYSCFSNLREVNGTLLLSGPDIVDAFKHITKVVGGEGFIICDDTNETYFLPNLIEVDGLRLPFDCSVVKHINVPNIETIGFFEISHGGVDPPQLSLISGFNKVIKINRIHTSGEFDSLTYDCFKNLEEITNSLRLVFPIEYAEVTSGSFENLERISESFGAFVNNSDLQFDRAFPRLKYCGLLGVLGNNVPPESMCYYKEHIESGDIENVVYDHNGFLSAAGVLALCE